jgi:hypothetical protein
VTDRDGVIDEAYEDPDAILEALDVPEDEDAVEHYGFKDETELVNYIFDVIALQPEDVDRLADYYENAKCPYCELLEEDKDPTLEHFTEEEEQTADYRPDVDTIQKEVTNLLCDTHIDAWIEFLEYEEIEEE